MNKYDVLIVGGGPGGLYAAYRLSTLCKNFKIAIVEKGKDLDSRYCPIGSDEKKHCVKCRPNCSIMSGFGGAGAFSDGKFIKTNDYGGTLYEYVGNSTALDLMDVVDKINMGLVNRDVKEYTTSGNTFSTVCKQNNMRLLSANIRHFGTDLNAVLLQEMRTTLINNGVDIFCNETVIDVVGEKGNFAVTTDKQTYHSDFVIVAAGRSGSHWVKELCKRRNIPTTSNKINIGVRVELPYEVFAHITDELYEGKIVYRTKTYEDLVRTFCMNPRGEVVTENTNGLITVNGHSYHDDKRKTNNTNFALLVSMKLTEPFNNSIEYGQSIIKLSNMLGNGVIVQRFGDLIRGRRTNEHRLNQNTVIPTLQATAGDLSLVLPKRILDDIIEMIYALNNVAPGTANDDTLLYGVEEKLYDTTVQLDNNLESCIKGLYFIGDGSGVTHSLAHASASGLYVADNIIKNK